MRKEGRKKENSLLGLIYEGAFKLGFLRDLLPDYENFKQKQIFEKLKSELESFENGVVYIPTLELLEKNIPFDIFEEVPQKLTCLDVENSGQKVLLFLFLLGYYQGFLYRKKFKKIELIKYHMGEESQSAGIYRNADLLFVAQEDRGKSLQILDFKLAGAREDLSDLFDRKEGYIPYRVFGLPVNLSLGELNFNRLVQNILKVKEKILSLKEVSTELKGFLQVLSYAVDYLSQYRRQDLKEVCLALMYPLSEPFIARFWLTNEDVSIYRDRIRELYEETRKKTWEYEEIDATRPVRIKRLRESTSQQIEELEKEISRRQKNVHTIIPDPIERSREDVEERLKWFLAQPDKVKILCLLHSAGSGKTSKTRELILNQEGKHIVFYFATRRVLIAREHDIIKKIAGQSSHNICGQHGICTVREERLVPGLNYVKLDGDTCKDYEGQSGIIQRTVERIKKLTTRGCRFIWAFATQQAIVGRRFRKGSTAEYISLGLMRGRVLRDYSFHFILDEFLGHPGGLFAIEELIAILKKIKSHGGRANLYIFDANGYTPVLLKKLLEEYREFETFPNALVLSDFKQEEYFEIDGIPFYSFARHGYPSPEVKLKKHFVFLKESIHTENGKKEFLNKLANILGETFTDREKSTAFAFIQYKEHLSGFMNILKGMGYKVLVATADSRKSQDEINKGKQDIILATSAISRGIDLSIPNKPVNHIYVVVYDWGIEGNLVELIQAISRARGDSKTEKISKTLNLIYVIEPANEFIVEKIGTYLDEEKIDMETMKLLYRKHTLEQKLILDDAITLVIEQFLKSKEGTVLVPVPNQYRTEYIPNKISDLEAILNFLDGVRCIENKEELYLLQKAILEALFANVVDFNFQSYIDYFHPYILSKERLRYGFDGDKRLEVMYFLEKARSDLKKHNEERLKELEEIVRNFLPNQEDRVSVLIPTYAVVLVKHFLRPGEKITFGVGSRIGRGGADVLMGTVGLRTECYVSDKKGENEYACIVFTEDYPYREVLSGRFVKFPVEFIKGLMEV